MKMDRVLRTTLTVLVKPKRFFENEIEGKKSAQFFALTTVLWVIATPVNPWLRLAYCQRLIVWVSYNAVLWLLYGILTVLLMGKEKWGKYLKALPFSYLPFAIAILCHPFLLLLGSQVAQTVETLIIVYWSMVFLWVIVLQVFILYTDAKRGETFPLIFLLTLSVIFVQVSSLIAAFYAYRLMLWLLFIY